MSKIILLTGPSGSGKTTTAKQFLEKQTKPWVYINQDDKRQLVHTSYETQLLSYLGRASVV
jgi:uridine kinase